jgi:hypothetical protein
MPFLFLNVIKILAKISRISTHSKYFATYLNPFNLKINIDHYANRSAAIVAVSFE